MLMSLLALKVAGLAVAAAGASAATLEHELTVSPAGTWHTSEISQTDAEATLRRYGLAKWIKRSGAKRHSRSRLR